MNLEQKKTFLINFAFWALIGLIALVAIRYILPISLPFVFGFLFAYLIIGISRKLNCRSRCLRLLMTLGLYGAMGFAFGYLMYQAAVFLTQATTWLPGLYQQHILPGLDTAAAWAQSYIAAMDPATADLLRTVSAKVLDALSSLVSFLSKAAVNIVSAVATGVPSTILSLLAMIFSTVFVVMDADRIRDFARANLPEKAKQIGYQIRDYLTGTLLVVIRAYLLIMLLTFTELSILFWIFGISHPIVKASLIAVLDILPLLGTGGIMIPWAIIAMITDSFGMGLKLLAIYGIVTVVRNYVEPRIVGTQLGLHPIITLVSMFLGLRLFGFLGLFGLPIAISFFWKQYKSRKAPPAAPADSQ